MELYDVRNQKNGIGRLFSIILILELFVNEDILIFGTYGNASLIKLKFVVQTISFILILLKNRIVEKTDSFYSFVFLSALIIISCVINTDIRAGYLFMIMIYMTVLLFLQRVHIDYVLEQVYQTMVVICAYSLFVYFLRALFPGIMSFFPVIKNVSNTEFYFCGLANVIVHPGGLLRNYGPFREPGVFQMFIIVPLIYALFRRDKIEFKKVSILVLALVTTFSTTGYIAFIFLITAFLFHKDMSNKTTKYVLLATLFVLFLYLVFGTDLMYKQGYGSVFGKLFGGYESISTKARMASVLGNLKIFWTNPIIGRGITFVDEYFPIMAQNTVGFMTRDNTNTVLIQLSRFGLPFVLIFISRYIQFFWNYISSTRMTKFLLLCSFFVLTVGENLTYSFLMSLFLFVPNKMIKE